MALPLFSYLNSVPYTRKQLHDSHSPIAGISYVLEGGEVLCAVVVDVLWLVAQDFPCEVVEEVRELAWDWELLQILARHLNFRFN